MDAAPAESGDPGRMRRRRAIQGGDPGRMRRRCAIQGGDRDSARSRGTVLKAWIASLIAATGLALVLNPPSQWVKAAADPRKLKEPGVFRKPPASHEAPAVPEANDKLVDVRVEGNTTIPAEHIAKFIKTRPGRKYDERQIRADVRNLYGKRWFFSVEPRLRRTKQGLVLIFHVIERPVVTRVVYKGNKQVATKKLAALTGLKAGSPFDVSANRQSVRRIQEHYKEEGYAFAKVELVKGGHRDDREVVFQIDEGPKVRVTSVTFVGNEFVSGPVLMTRIRTSRAILWTFGGLYDPETIKDDVAALKQYYYDLGFFDVDVKQKTGFNKDRSRAYFTYFIKEGKRYKVRRVVIAGNRVLDTPGLRKELKLIEGKPFNALQLAKDVEKIKAKYGAMGRIFAKIDVAPRFFENDDGMADLVYRIDEDFVYRIRRINVVFRDANAHTRRAAVLNRLLIHPGDLANPQLIKRTEIRLRGVGFIADGRRNPAEAPQIHFKRVKPDPKSPLETFRGQSDDDDSKPMSAIDTPVSRHPLARSDVPAARKRPAAYAGSLQPGDNPFDRIASQPSRGSFSRDSTPWRKLPASDPTLAASATALGGEALLSEDSESRQNVLPFTNDVPDSFYIRPAYRAPVIRGQNIENGINQPGSPLFNDDPNRPFPNAVREGDLDVIVSETQTGRLMFGVGVNSDAGVVGSIVLNEYNFNILRPPTSFQDVLDGRAFRGGAQRFRMEVVPGNIVSRYLVSWTDPYIFDTDYSLSLSGFFYNRFLPDWTEKRAGGKVAFGRQFTPEISVAGIVRIEDVEISNPRIPTPQLVTEVLGSTLLTTVGFSITHDTRDQAFLPGEGHLVNLEFEHAVGEFSYPKLVLNASQFFTVYQRPDGRGRHILTLRGQLGWTDSGTPVYERFFAGGFQTFRGFEFRGVGPRDLNTRIGGRWLALGSVEYMIPLMANEMLHGVVFTDFGTVENTVGFQDFRLSVGAGIRISIPQVLGPVPLAFDFGFPILKEEFDDERIFNFYVGFTR
jgi:outer membrane protein insertion porin family